MSIHNSSQQLFTKQWVVLTMERIACLKVTVVLQTMTLQFSHAFNGLKVDKHRLYLHNVVILMHSRRYVVYMCVQAGSVQAVLVATTAYPGRQRR